jgi:outer membrane protein assembly factor BamB
MVCLVGLAAACGGPARRAAVAKPTPTKPRRHHVAVQTRARLVITVIDGDSWRRVPQARVVLRGRSARTNRRGVAEIRVPRREPLHVGVTAPGFESRYVYEDFRAFRKVTVRIYRPELQWPLYARSQTHIRVRPPFKSVWSVGLGGLIEFPAVVDGGVAYIGNYHGTVRAISMYTGAVLWRHDTPRGWMASSPGVFRSELVYHGMDGHVWVLDRGTGHLLWQRSIGSPIESSPIVRDGVDYFGAWDGRLYALDLRTRRLRWVRQLAAKITSSATIANGTLYIGDYSGRLWALSTRTGATRWVVSVNGRIYGTAAVAGGRVFVPSSDGDSLTAFTTGGRYLWRIGAGSYVYSSPAAWGGRVFFGAYNGVFYGVSAASGRILWEVSTGGPISGAAVVVDGVAYAGSFAHRIVGVDARSGRVLVRFKHGQYVPVSGNGMRLLLHGYSTLYAVESAHVLRR